jgi:hypothetical protein
MNKATAAAMPSIIRVNEVTAISICRISFIVRTIARGSVELIDQTVSLITPRKQSDDVHHPDGPFVLLADLFEAVVDLVSALLIF